MLFFWSLCNLYYFWSQSSVFAVFQVVFETSYPCKDPIFNAGVSSPFFFSWHIVFLLPLSDIKFYVSSWVFSCPFVLRSTCWSSSFIHFNNVPSIFRAGQPRCWSLWWDFSSRVCFQLAFILSRGIIFFSFSSFIIPHLMMPAFNIPKYL